MIDLKDIAQSVIEGDSERSAELTKVALDAGVPAGEILSNGLVEAMRKVGELFEQGEYFLPEMLIAGEAMKASVAQLRPLLLTSGGGYTGKYLIGTVQGDVHDIGKNIVIMLLEGNGWEVTDLGVDVSAETFCEAAKEGDYDILGMSSLLTLTMPNLEKTIEALKVAGLRGKSRVMVGGAPVTQRYADQIGADGYASDAAKAVKVAEALLKKA